MRHRPSCNRIMGCDPIVAMAQHGDALVPWLLETIEANPGADGYWVFRFIRLLGELGDARAASALTPMLDDKRWEIPIRAAQALADLRLPESQVALEERLAKLEPGARPALEAMLRHAIARIDPSTRDTQREAIVALVPATREDMAAQPPIVVDILLEIVRTARLHRALPAARVGALHTNRFVREQALRTLAALRDTGGIPHILTRLDDPLPSIRALALEALQAITGNRAMHDPQDWRDWAATHDLDTVPEADVRGDEGGDDEGDSGGGDHDRLPAQRDGDDESVRDGDKDGGRDDGGD